MWIVRLALRRTYTFVVAAMLITVLGAVSIYRMSTDIFPEIDIPVVSVVWQYFGMPADEIETRIVLINERVLTAAVNDIEHIESQSLSGVGVIRIYFRPGAKIEAAVAQVTATCQTILKVLPPGITPPYIVRYSATSVPIVQIAVSSDTLTEQQIFDYCQNFVIQQLGTVQGARVPQPWGGKQRQIMVDLDLDAMYARGVSPDDVSTAISNQNLIIPAGTAKMGATEYNVKLNSSPDLVAAFNDIPIKTVNGVPVYVKNVAHVRDGYAVQTNVVRRDGRRAVLMTVLKGEGASTLDVVQRIREALPGIQAQLPPELKMEPLFDQSVFVRAAVMGVLKEGAIAAGLTALMILLFLGSWRSTLIVAISIPLSILTSIIALWALGYSLNTMTLGGMALAVGILVDDATVELENVHRNFGMNKPIRRAILDAAAQIAVPAFVSTLALGIAFGSLLLFPRIGQDFFPSVDAGQFRLHVRAPAGTRIEETERTFGQVEDAIRAVVPDSERAMILDNMGLTQSFTIMAYVDNGTVSNADGEILVSLKPTHRPTADYVARLREELPQRFPQCVFYFQPADITSQILNFGLPAPIDVQVVGVDRAGGLAVAQKVRAAMATIPGIADVHLHQITDRPDVRLNVDRTMASQLGLTEQDVAGSVLVSLSSTSQVSPNFWVNPVNRVNYRVAVQTPDYNVHSVDTLMNTPIVKGQTSSQPPSAPGTTPAGTSGPPAQLLGNLADLG